MESKVIIQATKRRKIIRVIISIFAIQHHVSIFFLSKKE